MRKSGSMPISEVADRGVLRAEAPGHAEPLDHVARSEDFSAQTISYVSSVFVARLSYCR